MTRSKKINIEDFEVTPVEKVEDIVSGESVEDTKPAKRTKTKNSSTSVRKKTTAKSAPKRATKSVAKSDTELVDKTEGAVESKNKVVSEKEKQKTTSTTRKKVASKKTESTLTKEEATKKYTSRTKGAAKEAVKKATKATAVKKPATPTKKVNKVKSTPAAVKAEIAKAEKEDTPVKAKKTPVKKTPAAVKKPAAKKVTPDTPSGIDVLISFDTTGSMYPVLAQVRQEATKLVTDLHAQIEDIRIGVIVHGDYCDAGKPYTLRLLDLTTDIDKIRDFINNSEKTYGGDADECYELVLNTAHEFVSWGTGRKHIMVMIGDANPHSASYPDNVDHLNWTDEAVALGKAGVKVFAVHALSYYRSSSKKFYETVAEKTGGKYLTLDYFSDVIELIKATCLSEYSIETLNKYVEIIRENNQLSNGIARNLNRLYGREVFKNVDIYETPSSRKRASTGKKTDTTRVQKDGLIPVLPGRFQTMTVLEDTPIKKFVEDNGIEFKRGRAFYELSKSEKVQQYKEILIQNRETGEMYNGAQVREYLGLEPQIAKGGVTERLNSGHTKEYRVFVQSTSVNRKLIGGTVMLYEMNEE